MLIVDEATQISTRDAQRLIRYAAQTGTVIVALGDPAQLSSVGAGGWFRHLADNTQPAVLRELRRQQGDQMRDVRTALVALRSEVPEHVNDALALLEHDGRVQVCDSRADLLINIVDDWYQDRNNATEATTSSRPRMMAATQRDVELLNRVARVRLADDGTLTGPGVRVGDREFCVGDEVVTLTQQGHTLIPHGQGAKAYIRTGTIGTVIAAHADNVYPDRQWLEVEFAGRGRVIVEMAYLEHDFGDGRHGGLAHAYALTADRSQGATMPTARAVTTDATSRQALYVMLSRAQHDVKAYVIRRSDIEIDPTSEDWLPVLNDPITALEHVARRLQASRVERLGHDLDPNIWAAHHLAQTHTLHDLDQMRQAEPVSDVTDEVRLIARAERLVEQRLATNAINNPPYTLVARIGPRPAVGTQRSAWDHAITTHAITNARYPADQPISTFGSEQRVRSETLIAKIAGDTPQPTTTRQPEQQHRGLGHNLGL